MWTVVSMLLVATPPPITQVVGADAMVWLHVPELDKSLAALEASGFSDLGRVMLPRAQRQLLRSAKQSELLFVAYRGSEPGRADVMLLLDVGPAEPQIVAITATGTAMRSISSPPPTGFSQATEHFSSAGGESMCIGPRSCRGTGIAKSEETGDAPRAR